MTDGLKDKHRKAIIEMLSANDRVDRAVLFGSRAMGTFTPTSDVDLALFGDDLALTDQAGLSEELNSLSIPQQVDILLFNSIKNKKLLKHIEQHGVEWWQRPGVAGDRWRRTTWGDEISLEYGKALRGYKEAKGPYRVYGSNGPVGWTFEPLAPGPGVILGRKGAYRGIEYSHDSFYVIDTAYYVKPRANLHMRWLYYAIKHYKLGEIDDGSPIPSTTRSAVYVRDLQVPQYDEQRAIAHILGSLDDKIELNRQMNGTLEKMAQAIFKSWFIDFDPVHAKAEGRDTGLPKEISALFPDSFEDSKLGKIPKGWGVERLVDACVELRRGISPKYTEEDGVLVINQRCVRGHRLVLENARRHDPAKRSVEGRFLKVGDMLVNSTGVGTLGRVAGVSSLSEPMIIDSHVTLLRADEEYFQRSVFCFSIICLEEEIQAMGEGSTGQTELSRKVLGKKDIMVPEQTIQTSFENLISPLLEKIDTNEEELRFLISARDTLLPKLISGELRIPGVEKFIEEVE